MPQPHLLPSNATEFEKAVALATDPLERFGTAVANGVAIKFRPTILPAFVDAALYEWGLDALFPWVDDKAVLLAEGIDYYRIRGTPAALDKGLDFIGYAADLEEAPIRRLHWNFFQLLLDRVRDAESPDLEQIEGIAQFSVCARSKLYRGYRGYDVRAAEYSGSKTSMALIGADSGVRLHDDGPVWSFGRDTEFDYTLTQADLEALGVWVASSGTNPTWTEANSSWSDFDDTWTATLNAVRQRLMTLALSRLTCFVEFKRSTGTAIGYRSARVKRMVTANANGEYTVGGQKYRSVAGYAPVLYIEALTDFGDGDGAIAASAALRFGAVPDDEDLPGQLWLQQADITLPNAAVASRAVAFKFGETVRETVRTLIRIPA